MSVLSNQIRNGFYLDSVALMRLSAQISQLPGVLDAALMIGSLANKQILDKARLLDTEGEQAGPNDLIIALRAKDEAALGDALAQAGKLLSRPAGAASKGQSRRPKSLRAALELLPDANLALVAVPGEFAAGEARRALRQGLHVMIFSDNVPIAEELALKQEALQRGLLLMGPDCGTALINGVGLAFANRVARGDIGIIAASGTGLQEVSCLIDRAGKGISQGIGVGGRDLNEIVGGLSTLAALDMLDHDAQTRHIVLLSKPPARSVAEKIMRKVAASAKPFTVCFIGSQAINLPDNATQVNNLRDAAAHAAGGDLSPAAEHQIQIPAGRRWIHGLYAGGTLCAEAQTVLLAQDKKVLSNTPVPGAVKLNAGTENNHILLDLGADEYTVGRPHPMLDPTVRNELLVQTLRRPDVAVVLLDLVLGYGAHADPASALAGAIAGVAQAQRPLLIASVCGTEADPQCYSRQVDILRSAGFIVMPSNAQAAEFACALPDA